MVIGRYFAILSFKNGEISPQNAQNVRKAPDNGPAAARAPQRFFRPETHRSLKRSPQMKKPGPRKRPG